MKKTLLAVALAALFFTACSDDDVKNNIICTLSVEPALVLTIMDKATDSVLTDGVTVTAVTATGNHTEQLNNYGSEAFTGLVGYGGNTTVTVKKEGYQDKVSEFFTEKGPCGTITTRDTIFIQPLP